MILREFSLRPDTGGKGMHRGGDGVIRDIEFRMDLTVSILSERRVFRPYGLAGGQDGEVGKNIWVRRVKKVEGSDADISANEGTTPKGGEETEVEYREVSIGGKNTAEMQAGERIIVMTPGGGGWGKEGDESREEKKSDPKQGWKGGSISSRQSEAEASA